MQKKINNYILRKTGRTWWLVNTAETENYIPPIEINETGAEIWQLMSQGKSNSQIAQELAVKYNIDEKEIMNDVEEFQKQLKGKLE